MGSLTYAGVIDDIANFITAFTKGNKFLAYTVIVWLSVLLSAFIDNIPYTVAMIPVAKMVAASLGMAQEPFLSVCLSVRLWVGTSRPSALRLMWWLSGYCAKRNTTLS